MRVAEIHSKTNVEDWLHVPSSENIADILTKGAPPSKLGQDSQWQNGPKWLVSERTSWPITDVGSCNSLHSELEHFKTAKEKLKSTTFVATGSNAVDILEKPGEVRSFSAMAVTN